MLTISRHSSEQLVIFETEVHHQANIRGIVRPPVATRRVHKTDPFLTRNALLQIARLALLLSSGRALFSPAQYPSPGGAGPTGETDRKWRVCQDCGYTSH